MIRRIKKLWCLCQLKYNKVQINYPSFKRICLTHTTMVRGILPVLLLIWLGVGIPSVPLGFGITFCTICLLTNEEAIEELFSEAAPLAKRNIDCLEEKLGRHLN